MLSTQTLNGEAGRYQALSETLRAEFATIDDETLTDTLEGLTDLHEMLRAVIRSSLFDEVLAEALKARIADMRVRLERLETCQSTKRAMACRAMGLAGLNKLLTDDFTVSRRLGQPRLEILNERAIPQAYHVPQPPKLDRAGLLAALKAGQRVAGASLQPASDHIQVRTK